MVSHSILRKLFHTFPKTGSIQFDTYPAKSLHSIINALCDF